MNPSPPKTPTRSPMGILFTTVFVDLLGFGIVIPLLPYYAYQFHASALVAGVLVAAYSAMQFLFAPLWGSLSDRIGRRPVLLVSLAGSTVSYLLFALAGSVAMLFVSRVLAGIMAATIPVAQAVVADTTKGEDRAKGMGLIGAAFGLGFIVGPALGGLLAHYGHWAPGALAAAICGANFLAAIARLPETRVVRSQQTSAMWSGRLRRLTAAARNPSQAALMALFAAVVFAFSSMEATLSLLCADTFHLAASQIYWLFGFLGLVNTVAQGGVVGRLAKIWGEPPLAIAGSILLALGLLATPYLRPWLPLLLALGALAFGQGMTSPTLLSLLSKASVTEDQGAILGVSQSLGSLARILGPLWGGFAFEHLGSAVPYTSTAVALLAVAAFCLPSIRATTVLVAELKGLETERS